MGGNEDEIEFQIWDLPFGAIWRCLGFRCGERTGGYCDFICFVDVVVIEKNIRLLKMYCSLWCTL